ncbi:MAG: hypothetical protein ACRDV3_16770 [Acidothermaceae bacterium]
MPQRLAFSDGAQHVRCSSVLQQPAGFPVVDSALFVIPSSISTSIYIVVEG